jgi:transcriptional regulator with XRE-family HTH domain
MTYCRALLRNRIARSIWMVRTARGISQRGLAAQLHTPCSVIARLERGERLPEIATLERIAQSLSVPCSVILRISEATENGKYSPAFGSREN